MYFYLAQPVTFLRHIGLSRYAGWLRGTVVERRSLTGEISLSYAQPAADG